MDFLILLGKRSRAVKDEPTVLYCGLDGERLRMKAAEAQAGGEYVNGTLVSVRAHTGDQRPWPVIPVPNRTKAQSAKAASAAELRKSEPSVVSTETTAPAADVPPQSKPRKSRP